MKVRIDEYSDEFDEDEDSVLIDEEIKDPEAPMYSRVSFGKWMIVLFLLAIPVVNIVMLLVWAIGSRTNPSLGNFSRAFFVYFILLAVLVFVFSSTIMNIMLKMVDLG